MKFAYIHFILVDNITITIHIWRYRILNWIHQLELLLFLIFPEDLHYLSNPATFTHTFIHRTENTMSLKRSHYKKLNSTSITSNPFNARYKHSHRKARYLHSYNVRALEGSKDTDLTSFWWEYQKQTYSITGWKAARFHFSIIPYL